MTNCYLQAANESHKSLILTNKPFSIFLRTAPYQITGEIIKTKRWLSVINNQSLFSLYLEKSSIQVETLNGKMGDAEALLTITCSVVFEIANLK